MIDTTTALTEQGVPETIEVIGLAIMEDMGLADGIVSIYNQRRKLRPAIGFFIDVALLGSTPHAVRRGYFVDPSQADLVEAASVNVQEVVQVDIFSYDESARLRKFDLVFALTSTAMQQAAERWAFKVGRVPPSLVDLSQNEGSARLNRYAVTFNILRAYGRVKAAPTLTQFTNPPKTLLISQ